MPITKIATCCYCGSRTTLVLQGKVQHELACGSCGAPLHDLKMLPKAKVGTARELVKPSRVRVRPADPIKGGKWDTRAASKKKKKKKKKSLAHRFFEEAFDVIEDIFD